MALATANARRRDRRRGPVTERPLLLLPAPRSVSRSKLGSCPPGKRLDRERQSARLGAQFAALAEAQFELVGEGFAGAEPEIVLAITTAGSMDEVRAVAMGTEGFEWLVDEDDDEDAADDFAANGKPPKRHLYMVVSNSTATTQLLRLWARYTGGLPLGVDAKLEAKWLSVFSKLDSIRRWGIEDRLRETGFLDHFLDLASAPDESREVEIELFYRLSASARSAAIKAVRRHVTDAGGSVLTEWIHDGIAYHGLLAKLPARTLQAIVEHQPQVALVACDDIMFFRPAPQVVFRSPDAEEIIERARSASAPSGEPVAALLDGLPLTRHVLLDGRLRVDAVDDPEYPAEARRHGTMMASLIVWGSLDEDLPAVRRPLLVSPILRPTFAGDERMPEGAHPLAIVEAAVARLFDAGDHGDATAPGVKLICHAVADSIRSFVRAPSPWARLLDWLSEKYRVLFIVPSGNTEDDIQLEPAPQTNFLFAETRCSSVLRARDGQRLHRRVLVPGEAMQAITVGAGNDDRCAVESTADPYAGAPHARALPAPYSRQGPGARRCMKPEIYEPGGRAGYHAIPDDRLTLAVTAPSRGPGQRVAIPRTGALDRTGYLFGTSCAAALATRRTLWLHDQLEAVRSEIWNRCGRTAAGRRYRSASEGDARSQCTLVERSTSSLRRRAVDEASAARVAHAWVWDAARVP